MRLSFPTRLLLVGTVLLFASLKSATPVNAVTADHTVISQFSSLSKSAIDNAASKKTLFMHQSTGGYISGQGLNCLAGLRWDPNYGYPSECLTYKNNRDSAGWPWYDSANFTWSNWPTSMADALAKTDQFVAVVNEQQANYQVIGMKFCYVDGWNQGENVSRGYYINKMEGLERQFPDKTFIWATSALWSSPGSACDAANPFNSCLQISQFNQAIRNYARDHNKPLYDIADIESHDSNGNPCITAGYEGMCAEWFGDSGGHPNIAGSLRLAKGFWWLMANLNVAISPYPTRTPTPTNITVPTSSPTPTPSPIPAKPGDANADGKVDGIDYVIWRNNYNKTVASGSVLGDFNNSGFVDGLDYVIWRNNYGK